MAKERAAAVGAAEAERLAAASAQAIVEPAGAELEQTVGKSEAPRPSAAAPDAPTGAPGLALLRPALVGAGAAWGLAVLLDRMPAPGTDLGRLTALALVLAGPATTVGAIMARVYWPRLVAVVVAGGLTTAVFVGRALLG